MSREGFSPHEGVPAGSDPVHSFEIPENPDEIQNRIDSLSQQYQALIGMVKEMEQNDPQMEQTIDQIGYLQSYIAKLTDSYAIIQFNSGLNKNKLH